MCTVTFLPVRDRLLITSNRDEQTLREPAALPEAVQMHSGKILFPRDGRAGGTWIALHNNGSAMVLLNGAFRKHHHNPPYKKSRGVIFLEIFDSLYPIGSFQLIDLEGIEPFTLVIWHNDELYEARWDGTDKYVTPLSTEQPHIWSSATLYDEEVVALRKKWFHQWLAGCSYISAESVRAFHEFGGDGDVTNNLKMNRNGLLQTVSITGIELTNQKAIMHYKDLLAGLVSVNEWFLNPQTHFN